MRAHNSLQPKRTEASECYIEDWDMMSVCTQLMNLKRSCPGHFTDAKTIQVAPWLNGFGGSSMPTDSRVVVNCTTKQKRQNQTARAFNPYNAWQKRTTNEENCRYVQIVPHLTK